VQRREADEASQGLPRESGPTTQAVAVTRVVWCVLVTTGLAVGLLALQGYRGLSGAASAFGPGQALDLYDRMVLLTLSLAADARLVLPLAALTAVTWLSRGPGSVGARRAAGGLAALLALLSAAWCAMVLYLFAAPLPGEGTTSVLGPRESKIDTFGGSLASSALLTALSVLLLAVTRAAAHDPAPPRDQSASAGPGQDGPDEDAAPAGAGSGDEGPDGQREVADPYARFRPPPDVGERGR
jgi:hypothetical protein